MKKTSSMFFFFIFSLMTLASAFANHHEKNKEPMDPKKQEMMKNWMEYSTPGAAHKAMAEMVGKWSYTSKFWEKADAQPQESSGNATFKMILGGRFLQNETKGKAMGMPFNGLGLTGYNNQTKKYETIWLDDMATGMMKGNGSGTYDETTKTYKDEGEYACPMKKKNVDYRTEWKIIDKDNMTFTMWGPEVDSSREIKSMEITYKRKKS